MPGKNSKLAMTVKQFLNVQIQIDLVRLTDECQKSFLFHFSKQCLFYNLY